MSVSSFFVAKIVNEKLYFLFAITKNYLNRKSPEKEKNKKIIIWYPDKNQFGHRIVANNGIRAIAYFRICAIHQ